MGSWFGIGGSSYSNVRFLFAFVSQLSLNSTYADQLDINDTEIFGTSVRIYRPVNRTEDGDLVEGDKLLPAVIYLHGGGWSVGSVGKLKNCKLRVSSLTLSLTTLSNSHCRTHFMTGYIRSDCVLTHKPRD